MTHRNIAKPVYLSYTEYTENLQALLAGSLLTSNE